MKQEPKIDRPRLIPKKTSYLRVILGTLLVLAGLAAALVTVLARQANQNAGRFCNAFAVLAARESGRIMAWGLGSNACSLWECC